jgi:hypothetical protein
MKTIPISVTLEGAESYDFDPASPLSVVGALPTDWARRSASARLELRLREKL